ncbi:hypothetical protein [Moorena sp. SIO4G3]|uniref:hypothetical protein n=1 Tax=Moorena sp. SIO4G3 TaxID=2607821 RepID=UPI00142C5EE6|nr:hypothetical protein [Moorena sp. SIO4G3]NEO76074.1 hypothetical protein [Moorena sp. SIO4G3]
MPVHLTDHISQSHHVPGIFILNSNLSIGQNTDHIAQSHHVPGIFILNSNLSIGQNIEELIIIGQCSYEQEYQDQIIHLPIT